MLLYAAIVVLVLLSGLFSGLNLGLLGLNKGDLERKIRLGNKLAERVYTIRKHDNLLLCTVLLGNVAVNATIAILLESVAGGILAGVIATALILIFGEIVPQAYCTRNALAVGAAATPFIRVVMFLTYPVAAPLAFALDRALGMELPTVYNKAELCEIFSSRETTEHTDVDRDEQQIVMGALTFSDRRAKDVLTPRTVVYALEVERLLDAELLTEIRQKGFTRIPIYEEHIDNVLGLLNAKQLIGVAEGVPVRDMYAKEPPMIVPESIKLDALLGRFISTRNHMALVVDEFGGLAGIVTLEDVIEEIIRSEILDETDHAPDMQKVARDRARDLNVDPPAEQDGSSI